MLCLETTFEQLDFESLGSENAESFLWFAGAGGGVGVRAEGPHPKWVRVRLKQFKHWLWPRHSCVESERCFLYVSQHVYLCSGISGGRLGSMWVKLSVKTILLTECFLNEGGRL